MLQTDETVTGYQTSCRLQTIATIASESQETASYLESEFLSLLAKAYEATQLTQMSKVL